MEVIGAGLVIGCFVGLMIYAIWYENRLRDMERRMAMLEGRLLERDAANEKPHH